MLKDDRRAGDSCFCWKLMMAKLMEAGRLTGHGRLASCQARPVRERGARTLNGGRRTAEVELGGSGTTRPQVAHRSAGLT